MPQIYPPAENLLLNPNEAVIKDFPRIQENGRSGRTKGRSNNGEHRHHRICALRLKSESRITRNRPFGGYWIGMEEEMSE
jgi:hypothetical protein